MNVGKRLFQYALIYKKMIIFALAMLTVAVAAELTGPFIAKKMIDNHILGIEKPWIQVEGPGEDTVEYKGNHYIRTEYFDGDASEYPEVRILQVKRDYFFINESVEFDGKRSLDGNNIVIEKGDRKAVHPAEELSGDQLLGFYQPEVKWLIYLSAFYLGLLVISAFFTYWQKYVLQKSANGIIQHMRTDVFGQIQRLPVNYFDNLPAGKVVSRITNDTEAIRELYVTVLAQFFTGIIYIFGILTALFLLDVRLAMICSIIIPIMFVWIIMYRKYASKYNHLIRQRLSDLNAMINESIQGMPIIQAFRRQDKTTEEFETINQEYFQYRNKLLSLDALMSHNLVGLLRNIAFVTLIWYFGGASLTATTVVSIGVLYAFVDYLNRLFQPIMGIVTQLANLEQALVSGERVFRLLDREGEDVSDTTVPRYEGNVVFDDVTFAYKEDDYVLKNISFEAKQGETVALVGHTGSGKSSIMNLLFRFYDIEHGKIMIDGQDIQKMTRQDLRKHMGIVLQDPFLFTGTLATNVSLDDPTISRETVEKALRDVGAEPFIQQLPNGYDEPVIEKGSTLSAGQRQLISFARALAYNPSILILDEATANIDTETEAIIQKALDVLKEGRTTFIIAHRLSTIKSADQILVLDRGQIVERGSHDELMKAKGKYFQMYQLQQGSKQSQAV
ncbi:ABC transporter ATP-binding protein [Pseudalkalibacillus berkeleyi]|uniref:ABC transporter ATP-binding protein/permease n=1 Tax=Pseudalkalibacillus berkeleyi TaxID=1069813 RepID=A0ABS9GTH5_9BACL|nr:ABC transporter ATP-binding protein [Pseudalkalibacillus berkeleyi]MCF6136137.1 ABC transporter ATP-binding protein/permease [Pseudalkalibacillus berkeleyi]